MSFWFTALFWTAAALLSALAGWLVLTLARRRALAPAQGDPGLAVHRRQLAEIDDLVARGLLSPAEQAEVRAEAGKRLLAADDVGRPATLAGGRAIATAAAVLAPLMAFGIYLVVGSPGRADAPMAARIAAWSKADPDTLTAAQIAAALTEVAKKTPNDPKLLQLLAKARLESDDPFGAAKALRQAVAAEPRNPELWTQLGELFVLTGNGEIGLDARKAFGEAQRLDPGAASPRYHLGLADIADGKPAQGLATWRALLADLLASDPRRDGLAAEIAEVSRTGRPPAPQQQQAALPAGPDMGPAIRGMVDGLAARLEADPNDPEGWARLVRAYGVLGEISKRDAALARARSLYKDQPQVLDALKAAAEPPQGVSRP
ncbi:MAG: c-type cytochrome biogenesis protein CcmI [Caulobacteraceae bacterium]|nr:MAG: c-type cytochrome biogenesis protein CcmI [Caulobacteraceae bacterium]